MDSELGSAAWFSDEARKRLRRIGMVGIEALAFGSCILFHLGMAYGLNRIISSDYKYLHKFLDGAVILVFSSIYLAIAIDTLVIFVPALGGLKHLVEGTHKAKNEPIQEALFPSAESPD
jgi:hypothetical protein